MGAGEEGIPTKSSKHASSAQEAPSTPAAPAYPDWSMQAFYGPGATPPFYASSVSSPTPHPFLWGSQHPMMPPYGTPVPYSAMYHPHGVYAHPSMVSAPGTVHGTAELNGRATEVKDHAPSKKNKGTSGNHVLIGGKNGDSGNAASGSGNDFGTQSGESGSEGSSDGTDDNNNIQEYSATKKRSFDQMLVDGANTQNNPVASIPTTNLNIGWNASPAAMKLRPNRPGGSAPPGLVNDQWAQDERELKKQKRKQSNRESARRSRLRKQAECEELQHRVESLNDENRSLSDQLQRLSEECEKITSENDSIKEELIQLCGPDVISKLESSINACEDEGNS